jgi:hypothetical protein
MQNQLQKKSPKESEMSLACQSDLIDLVTQCFDSLNNFGKTNQALPNIIKFFIVKLKKYPFEKVYEAFDEWTDRHSTMPTPADIINIIEPLPEYSKTLYISLCEKKKNDIYLSPQQRQFMAEFEKHEIKKTGLR